MNQENKTQPETGLENNLPPKKEAPLAETMAHVVRSGGTQLETSDSANESSKRQPSSGAKSSAPNRAVMYPANSSHPLPSSLSARQKALAIEGVPELPLLHPEERYQLEGEFARGGLGRILKAHDERLNRPVAMKEMLRRTGGNAEKRFLREALITAKLEHPGIIPVHDLGRWDSGGAYYTMKLVAGKSFDKIIGERKLFEERLALLPHVIDACDAMAYAHSQHIIHRDLKPGNILLGSFGETVVIDWGIAKELGASQLDDARLSLPDDDGGDGAPLPLAEGGAYREPEDISQEQLTKAGSVLGTPAYMPLEQARGTDVDARADVYALGAILYHVLSGRPPITGRRSLEVLQMLFDGGPQPIEQREPNTPKELATIINKAMAREAKDRYPTASELVADLKAYQTGKLVGAHAYSASELFWRWLKKNRIYLGASAASLLVIGVLSTLHYFEVKEQRDQANKARATAVVARDEAEYAKAREEKQRKDAQAQAEDLKLQAARDALDKDPSQAVAWLKQLDPSKKQPNWGSVRTILADALSRGVPTVLGATWNDSGAGHVGEITSLSFSPDGALLASTGIDQTIKLWDVKTKKLRATLTGHTDRVTTGAFSPNGALFASSGAEKDSTVRLWDTSTGKQIVALTGHSGIIRSLVFSLDNQYIATAGTDGVIRLWDATGARADALELKGHTGEVRGLSFSPEGALASIGADGLVLLWDTQKKTSKVVARYEAIEFNDVAFSPRGTYLAWGGRDPRGISIAGLHKTQDKKTFEITPSGQGVGSVRFSPDEEILAVVQNDDKNFLLLSPASCNAKGCPYEKLDAHEESVGQLVFSPDQTKMISASADQTIKLWSTKTKTAYRTLRGTNERVKRLAISPNGEVLASASPDGLIRLWELTALEERALSGHQGIVRDVVFSPNGELLASSSDDATTRIWRFSDGALLHTFSATSKAPVFSAKFLGDKQVATVDFDKITVWSLEDGALVSTLSNHKHIITSLAVSPDGALLASTSVDKTINLWDIASGKALWTATLPGESANEVTFSPDGKTLASLGFDRTVRFWDVANGKLLRESVLNGCAKLFYSPDGKTLSVSGCSSVPQLWALQNSSTITEAKPLLGHTADVLSAAFSRTGDRIATASYDDTSRIFDLSSNESRALPSYGTDVESVAFSPSGERIAIASDDTFIHLFADTLPTTPEKLQQLLSSLPATPLH